MYAEKETREVNRTIEDSRDRIIIELKQEIAELKESARTHLEPWNDISLDCIRLDKSIRRSEKRQRKRGISDESFIKLANCMAYLIQTKAPLADQITQISKLAKKATKLNA